MRYLTLLVLTPLFACNPEPASAPEKSGVAYEELIIETDPETAAREATELRSAAAVEVNPGLELSLWASDSLVTDPIAISFAPDGRLFYTRAERMKNSEFDVRGHMDWTEGLMALQTVGDKRNFLRSTFTEGSEQSEKHLNDLNKDGVKDWRDLAVEEESVWFVTDRDGDGVADRTQRFLTDFHEEYTDVANGLTFFDGDVYVAVAPGLWKASDDNKDGTADRLESLATGFGVHVGFGGHGMSGVTVGPQGRIWWGIGDIGSQVTDPTGKEWRNPNRGVIARCDPDGSHFEIFAHGLRNTHEFAFDDYGNLITVDNDGDHAGERERLVYLIDGSDTGWRINWQYGKYTDPKNNDYKVWMDENMHTPRHAEQAAYFLPPIQNYVNGPTGLVYNPGTALGADWKNHFFVAEFRGGPGNSPIHAFTMEPDGAGFKLGSTKEVVSGLLPTGLDFGPDGALYFGDWINGWGAKGKGKIWKLDRVGAAAGAMTVERRGTARLLAGDLSARPANELAALLAYPDQRVRRTAQFALAKSGEEGTNALRNVALTASLSDEIARVHAVWGLAQQVRYGMIDGAILLPLLDDTNSEILAQTAKMIGDQRITGAGPRLIELLKHESPRVRFFATEALGRLVEEKATVPIVAMLEDNDDRDVYLRQAGMIALARIGDDIALPKLSGHPSRAVRTAAVVALRRMESPFLAGFLQDSDPYIVAEAARGIHDDFSIPDAMPDLAAMLGLDDLATEVVLRRAISANLRLGEDGNADALLAFARRPDAPTPLRADALHALSTWAEPSVFDRVTGRHRGIVKRDDDYVASLFRDNGSELMTSGETDVRLAALSAAGNLNFDTAVVRNLLLLDPAPAIRAAALTALSRAGVDGLADYLQRGLEDQSPKVRSVALSLLPASKISGERSAELYRKVVETGTVPEAQTALAGLGELDPVVSISLLREFMGQLREGAFKQALRLDLVAAAESINDAGLQAELDDFEKGLMAKDSLGYWAYALVGGDHKAGMQQFYNNTAGQCTRCHAVFEYGGNVGPGLEGVAGRLSPRELLTSLIQPSALLAPGYETVLLELNDGSAHSGILLERTATDLALRIGKTDTKVFALADIASQETLPSSMPSVKGRMNRREVRDLVSWLARLKGERTK